MNEEKSRAVSFNYVVSNRFTSSYSLSPIRLQGLDPAKKYRLKEINVFPGTVSTIDSSAIYSGEFLMNVGFNPRMSGRRTSVIVEIVEVR